MIQYKFSYLENPKSRAIALAIGWSFAETTCFHLFYLISNATCTKFILTQ